MARPYRDDMDFAFFAVNFGYSKRDYLELTPREKAFIFKAYETRSVSWITGIRDAVFNALINAFRKRRKKTIPLFRKVSQKADIKTVSDDMKLIQQIESNQNEKSWIQKIYEANGKEMKRHV